MLPFVKQFEKTKELVKDEDLMNSFCWELIRHNGPPVAYRVQADTDVQTSGGQSFRVKSNTMLWSNMSAVLRDPQFWIDPTVFKAERFKTWARPEHPLEWATRRNAQQQLQQRDPHTNAEP